MRRGKPICVRWRNVQGVVGNGGEVRRWSELFVVVKTQRFENMDMKCMDDSASEQIENHVDAAPVGIAVSEK